jgi:hypothetical protein
MVRRGALEYGKNTLDMMANLWSFFPSIFFRHHKFAIMSNVFFPYSKAPLRTIKETGKSEEGWLVNVAKKTK